MTLPNSSTYQGQVVYEDLYRGEEYDYQLDDQGQVVYEDLYRGEVHDYNQPDGDTSINSDLE